ncbi:hybrid sensor histidine kinase/response regulator [Roseofilum sp. BLCC_M91]|uniref:histidine kinase n=1 Tax=Roseofilum halophilum BLCC-M91 TaxID=3022259 RepID=A0ABT7BJC8_9CYAN|nr:hybrid sensor histidine kinase/response regulator [Roseofilum halophilum]MDJ1179294.1 hybrid sensor histidine kinase/response regulator [Roseofilum halophilum BLCC-M91]
MATDPTVNRRPARILAVDDAPDNLMLIEHILGEEGYEINCQSDSQQALQEIERFVPDLILLDVVMPDLDGYAFTRRIRDNPYLPFIPILLITAYDRSSVVEGLDAGADDFIRKPVDVNELLARVRSLLRLKQTLDEREDFVSRLTHDLRTPLVAADRMFSLFRQDTFGPLTPDMAEALFTMQRSNQNLLNMVNTLLEVYRYAGGRKALTFSKFDYGKLVQEVVDELSPLAEEKGLQLNFETLDGAPIPHPFQAMGDPLELRRVVINLVGNAIKFTQQGSIDIRLELIRSSEENIIRLQVQDTGHGIIPEEQNLIFERFRQSKSWAIAGKSKRLSSGLGLYLSRRIVEAHHGTLTLESEPGKGSIFTVDIPQKISRPYSRF